MDIERMNNEKPVKKIYWGGLPDIQCRGSPKRKLRHNVFKTLSRRDFHIKEDKRGVSKDEMNRSIARLEEDYKCAQQLLEEREEELLHLTEEIEDGIQHALPSETHHMQMAYQHLEEELASVQSRYEKVTKEHMKCTTEIENWCQKYQEANRKLEEYKRHNELLKVDLIKRDEDVSKMQKDLQNALQQLEDSTEQLRGMSEQLEREKQEGVKLRGTLKDVLPGREALEQHFIREASTSSNPEIAQLCDSLKDLSEGVRHELDKSGRLDDTLASFIGERDERGESLPCSTRDSSVVSNLGGIDSAQDVELLLQELVRKVHEEGIQVLSLAERRYLHKHSGLLDNTKRSLLIQTESGTSTFIDFERENFNKERTQLLRQISCLEEEVSNKEKEIKRQKDLAEFQLEQEKILSNVWKVFLESEKGRCKDLIEQLQQAKLSNIAHASEISFSQSQLSVLRSQLKETQEENCNLWKHCESATRDLETLRSALQAERNNFTCLSKTLNDQRNLAETTKTMYVKTIEDLQNALENEREKFEEVNKMLSLIKKQCKYDRKMSMGSSLDSPSSKLAVKSDNSKTAADDLQVRLAVEQEKVIELQRICERLQAKISSLNEKLEVERSHANVDLMEEQTKLAEYAKKIKNNDLEKEKLLRIIEQDKENLKQQKLKIRELENQITKLDNEIRAQTAAQQVASHKVREDEAQLHLTYNRNVQKVAELEEELCTFRQRIKLLEKKLEIAQEKEKQLQDELTREKTAVSRLGLPALARSNNLSEFFELQVKENFELCKSVLRNIDERRDLREKVSTLEDNVADLTQKLVRENSVHGETLTQVNSLKKDCALYEKKVTSLRSLVTQKEAELARLGRKLHSRANCDNNNHLIMNERVYHIHGDYQRLKMRNRALIYQKQYLLKIISCFQESEQHSIARLHTMAREYHDANTRAALASPPVLALRNPRSRFRSCILAVIALIRMQSLAVRWHQKECYDPLRWRYVTSPDIPTSISSPEAPRLGRPGSSGSASSISYSGLDGAQALAVDIAPRFQREGGASYTTGGAPGGDVSFRSATGMTPPTKGPPRSTIPQETLSEFPYRATAKYDEFIDRLDNIHYKLGLKRKK
ncbi:hypothetical protein SK128_023064 [Halocaridina rubra]|uniref:Pericentrin/AKAP-450 centrosomal targeting domain-containing protein n=1 Tax=Halocaridina rubra TaxID=373956 RepID=A0AAN8ZWB3_HALRR